MLNTPHLSRLLTGLALLAGGLSPWAQAPRLAEAASLVVTSLADTDVVDGACTLREAILAANANAARNECVSAGFGADVITFGVTGTLTLTAGLPVLTDPAGLIIDGGGRVRVDGDLVFRLLQVNSDAVADLRNLTLARGNAGAAPGGGLHNAGATQVHNTIFVENRTQSAGGGIYNTGALTITASTFSLNRAADSPAAQSRGGAVHNGPAGTLILAHSTLVSNTAIYGGGLYGAAGSTAHIQQTTFSGNFGAIGPSLYVDGGATASVYNSTLVSEESFSGIGSANTGSLALFNSLVVVSPGGMACVGPVINGGHNLETSTACGWSTNGSHSAATLLLFPLAWNGSPTQTHALRVGSPARNGGNNTLLPPDLTDADGDNITGEPAPFDQRGGGFARIIEGTVDVGAFEAPPLYFLPLLLR